MAIGAICRCELNVPGQARADQGKLQDSKDQPEKTEHQSHMCGVNCCQLLLRQHGIEVDRAAIEHVVPISERGATLYDMMVGCQKLGLAVVAVRTTPAGLEKVPFPAIAHVFVGRSSPSMGHYLLLTGMDSRIVSFIEPMGSYGVRSMPRADFFRCWSGVLLVTNPSLVDKVGIAIFVTLLALLIGAILGSRLVRRRNSTVWLVVIVGIGGASFVSCSGKQHADIERHARDNGKCGLMAWNPKVDVGILPEKGESVAEFTIENLGAVEETIELGHTDCKCSSVAVDKKHISPGGISKVKIGIKGNGSAVGRISSRVLVHAVGHDWVRELTASGIGIGWRFSGAQYILTTHTLILVEGKIVTRDADTPVLIEATSPKHRASACFTVAAAEISKSVPLGSCFVRDVSIPIKPIPKEMAGLQEDQLVTIPVRIRCDGVEGLQSIELLVAAPAGSNKMNRAN
jgi:hypothetical protein